MPAQASYTPEHRIYAAIISVLFFIIGCVCVWLFDGTTDIGDSVGHYLRAKYAPLHPELFFDHWAKPLYVLLFAPIASLGFEAVKVQNLALAAITIYVTFLVANRLGMRRPWLAALFVACCPEFLIISLSGLTEPLFACMLITSIYLILREKFVGAALLVSFLPFVRSEGLLFIGLFGLLFLLRKRWKVLPLLVVGHVVYSLVGWQLQGDLWWVFTKIPYASTSSPYGSGDLSHFVEQLYYITGLPINVLFWIGVITAAIWLIAKRKQLQLNEVVLIWGGVFVFVLFHSIVWYKGMFNSMGLPRVLVGIVPLVALVALHGYSSLVEWLVGVLDHRSSRVVGMALLFYIALFPIIPNPASITVQHDLAMKYDQRIIKQLAEEFKRVYAGKLIYDHPYISEVFGVDHFDPDQTQRINEQSLAGMSTDDLLIWDEWFSVVENGVKLERVQTDTALQQLANDERQDDHHRGRLVVFEKRTIP